MTCHYPGTVLWLVLLIVWSKFPPWHSQSEVRARSKRWHFSMEFIYMESNSKHHFVQKPTLASWNVGSFIKQIQSWILYIYLVDIFVLRLGCWLLSYYLGCWKQQLASSCTHHVSRRFQATHENLLVGWKLNTYVLFLNDFFYCLLELFCFVGYVYWDWSLFDTQLIPRKLRKIAHQSLPTRKKAHKVNHLCYKRYIYICCTTKARLVVKSKTNFWMVLFHFTLFASKQTVWLASKTSFYPEMCFLGTASLRIVHHSNKYFFMLRLLQATFLKHHEKFTSTSR